MSTDDQKNLYFLLDSRNTPLARGILVNPPDAPIWQVEILDDKISEVMKHEELQLIPLDDGGQSLLGRIVRSRNDFAVVEKLHVLDSDLRQNLRMPVEFDTFIYPLTGRWRGRRGVQSNDLSCGGIAFFGGGELDNGELVEIVVPITTEPLILRCQILRRRPSDEGSTLYAAKFVNMCHDEEALVREAVFSVQVRNRPKSADPA